MIKIDGYPIHELTLNLEIEVAAGKLEVNPEDVRIGQPIRVTVSGLDRFVQGFSVRISNGPTLLFDGETRFASDGSGTYTDTTVIPEDYHRDWAEERTYPATFHVYQSGDRLPGVVATVTLLPQRYATPTPIPTNTPLPTNILFHKHTGSTPTPDHTDAGNPTDAGPRSHRTRDPEPRLWYSRSH